MKNSKLIIATLGLCAAGLMASQPAFAAPGDELKSDTKGTITFGVDDISKEQTTVPDPSGGDPVEVTVDPEKDGVEHTEGVLRIQFAPHFNFGTYAGYTAKEAKKNALVNSYWEGKVDPTTADEGDKKPMAPFVQIGEFRGAGVWKLEVVATPFTNKAEPTDILTGAHIELPGSTLTMERKTNAEAKTFVKGQKDGATTVIDTEGNATHIMQSIEGETVTGYKVSNVFKDNYTKDMTYVDGETDGVTFVKPAGIAPKKDATYESTLTWTLSDTL